MSKMLGKHAHTIAMINRDRPLSYLVRDYFGLRRGASLMPALLECGLGQADLVLALLRLRDRHRRAPASERSRSPLLFECYLELLVGQPIAIGEPCLQRYRDVAPYLPAASGARTGYERKITFVAEANPRQPNTEAHAQWSEYKVGRTLQQLHLRGVSKREIRRAIQNVWIKVEALAAAAPDATGAVVAVCSTLL